MKKSVSDERSGQYAASMQKRANLFITFAMLALVAAIIYNLADTAIVNNEKYQELANSSQFGTISISADRGTIYDSNGKVLAQSATVFKVYMDPAYYREYETEDRELIIEFLMNNLDLDEETIIEAMNKDTQYYVLKTQVEKTVADKITEFKTDNKIGCLQITEDTKRYYPQNDLACSIVGFTNYDGDGQYGIEYAYDEYLSGTDGKVISAKDAYGNEMPYRYSKLYEAQDGNSITLTIDSTLQYYLEKNLKDMCQTNEVANRATGIIMNANTGAVLAMATYPSYDLNNPYEITDESKLAEINAITDEEERKDAKSNAIYKQWTNKAITEIYVPGSVFKVITSSAALEENAITKDDTFNCTGFANVAGINIHCWKTSGHGLQTFFQTLTNSCNPAFMEIGARLGAEKFYYYFEAFGFTERTGIDLPSEVNSYTIKSADDLGPVELASCSFGQTNKITPIQMITAYAAVINGGNLVTPYVVSKITDADGNIVKTAETVVKRQVISEETSAIMREALENVVNDNGGGNSYIKGYNIGGKSGTSQKLDEYGEEDMRYVSSYCCFAPADSPEIIMLILADEPMAGDYYGSVVVVPYATKILEEALPYLGYYPEYSDDEITNLDKTVPDFADKAITTAKSTLESMGLTYQVVGSGTNVVSQVPTSGSSIAVGGKVILYTESDYVQETVTVPNLVGSTLEEANALLTDANLNYITTGASTSRADSTVLYQSYTYGEKVPIGTVIELTFAVKDQSG